MSPSGESVEPDVDREDGPTITRAAAIREQVTTLVLAVAIAMSIRAMVIEPFRIPSGSIRSPRRSAP